MKTRFVKFKMLTDTYARGQTLLQGETYSAQLLGRGKDWIKISLNYCIKVLFDFDAKVLEIKDLN